MAEIATYHYGEKGNITADTNILSGASVSFLTIESLPGIEFYLTADYTPIMIGASGQYTLQLPEGFRVTYLSFPESSLKRIDANPSSYILVNAVKE